MPISLSKPGVLGCFTVGSGADLVDRIEEADDRSTSGNGADQVVNLNGKSGRLTDEPVEPRLEIDLRDPMDEPSVEPRV